MGSSIDERAVVYGSRDLFEIGDGCRIDAFCIISVGPKGIRIGRNTHISAGVYMYGGGGRIEIGDYCFISPRATLYTATDEMKGDALVGSCCPEDTRRIITGDVKIEDGAGVGTGGIVFPGVTIRTGGIVGAMSIAKEDVLPGEVVVGSNQRTVRRHDVNRIKQLIVDANRKLVPLNHIEDIASKPR